MLSKLLTKIGLAILVLAIFDLAYINWWILQNQKSNVKDQKVEAIAKNDSASPVSSPIALPSASSDSTAPLTKTVETKTVVERETQVVVQNAQKEVYIPIGSGSTKSSTYVDLAGLEVNVDTNKYPNIDYAVFEASIYVDGANGQVHTQLYNVSDKHPVWYSEMKGNAGTASLVTSPKITLEKGVRAYRVQAKTDLVDYAAHVENARIKLFLK